MDEQNLGSGASDSHTGPSSFNQSNSVAKLKPQSMPTAPVTKTPSNPKRKMDSDDGLEKRPLSTPKRKKTAAENEKNPPLSERQQMALALAISAKQSGGSSPQQIPTVHHTATPRSAKSDKRNAKGESPIHLAAIRGDISMMKQLIRNGADVNVQDFAGWTPLHEACNHGYLSAAHLLLRKGANVNVQGFNNDTPLHDASANGQPDLVALLLKYGADPSRPNSIGNTPLDVAGNNTEIERLLRREEIYQLKSDDTDSISSTGSPSTRPGSPNLTDDPPISSLPKSTRELATPFLPTTPKQDPATNPLHEYITPKTGKPIEQTTPKSLLDEKTTPNAVIEQTTPAVTEAVFGNVISGAVPLALQTTVERTKTINKEIQPSVSPTPSDHGSTCSTGFVQSDEVELRTMSAQEQSVTGLTDKDNDQTAETKPPVQSSSAEVMTEPVKSVRQSLDFTPLSVGKTTDDISTEPNKSVQSRLSNESANITDKKTEEAVKPVVAGEEKIEADPENKSNSNILLEKMRSPELKLIRAEDVPELSHSKTVLFKDSDITAATESQTIRKSSEKPVEAIADSSVTNTKAEAEPHSADQPQSKDDLMKINKPVEMEVQREQGQITTEDIRKTTENKTVNKETEENRSKEQKSSRVESLKAAGEKSRPVSPALSDKSRPRTGSVNQRKKRAAKEKAEQQLADSPGDGESSKDSTDSTAVTGTVRSTRARNKNRITAVEQETEPEPPLTRETRRKAKDKEKAEMRHSPAPDKNNRTATSKPSDKNKSAENKEGEDDSKEETTSTASTSVASTPAHSNRRQTRSHTKTSNIADKLEENPEPPPKKKRYPKPKPEPVPITQPPIPLNAPTDPTSIPNPIHLFKDMRAEMTRRWEQSVNVQPKAPKCYNNFLINTKQYLIQSNSKINSSKMAIPTLVAPVTLNPVMTEFFNSQERERYKLRQQHLIERDKLRILYEQEVMRVLRRGAVGASTQAPISVCSVLKDLDSASVYHPYNALKDSGDEKTEKTNTRSHFNNRQLLSWKQDAEDKFENLKEQMISRHHHEAEALLSVQRMDWEWKLKECGAFDYKATPVIDTLHVPLVQITDDLDMIFPA